MRALYAFLAALTAAALASAGTGTVAAVIFWTAAAIAGGALGTMLAQFSIAVERNLTLLRRVVTNVEAIRDVLEGQHPG